MYVSVAEGACQSSASQKWAKEKKNGLFSGSTVIPEHQLVLCPNVSGGYTTYYKVNK